MLQHPDVIAIIKARDEYTRLKRSFIDQVLNSYRTEMPSLESFQFWLRWVVYDKELIQEILTRVEKEA